MNPHQKNRSSSFETGWGLKKHIRPEKFAGGVAETGTGTWSSKFTNKSLRFSYNLKTNDMKENRENAVVNRTTAKIFETNVLET